MATKNISVCNNDRVVPSFVSSNSYYGYVAPALKINDNDQQESCVPDIQIMSNGNLHDNQFNNSSMMNKRLNEIPVNHLNQNSYHDKNHCQQEESNYFFNKSSAMETDDDYGGINYMNSITQKNCNDSGGFDNNLPDFERYKSRKRNNQDDLMTLFGQSNGQFKKFKEGKRVLFLFCF